MAWMTTTNESNHIDQDNIVSRNNLTVCRADYFQICWCQYNSSEPLSCSYLLNHAVSYTNASYVCIYHTIRKTIECFNSTYILSNLPVSNMYIYLSILLFIIGLIGNGASIVILLSTKLRSLCVYRNLTIYCFLNILYLALIVIRYRNNYQHDLRDISTELCRLHTFTVAFVGHLCSWQLVSTSIQRIHALLSLQSHRTTSWITTCTILFICVILPLFIFDGQLLFNYGLFQKHNTSNEPSDDGVKQFRRALKYPIHINKNIPLKYHLTWMPTSSETTSKGNMCILWNLADTIIYAILPFIITLVCSFIIIIKVCQRRRSTVISGGICHINRVVISPRDHLSTLLITINILFLIMTAPLNIFLVVQSIFECFFGTSISRNKLQFFNEYLRLLQNSYHALSFIFYCVIGNKFRNSAKSTCRTLYYKLLEFGFIDRCTKTRLFSCCLDRRRSSSSGHTTSSNSRLSEHKRLTGGQRRHSSVPLHVAKRSTYVTLDITVKTVRRSTTTTL